MTEQRPSTTQWDPNQYHKYSDHRLRPGLELLDRIPVDNPHQVYDLGCGTGNLTRLVSERWPNAQVIGLDNSDEMIEKARAEEGSVEWLKADIQMWLPDAATDVIYSNAALQWVEGHRDLIPRLAGCIKPGGALAIQMPLSWGMPSHILMRETLARGGPNGRGFGSDLLRQTISRKWVEDADVYYDLLSNLSQHLDIWQTEYLQVLEGNDPVLEWVKGTGLRPILEGLADDERQAFLDDYGQRLGETYPRRPDGRTLYPFRRLFIVATV